MGSERTEANHSDGELQKSEKWGFSTVTRQAASILALVVFVGLILVLTVQLISLLLVLFLGVLFAVFLRGLTNWVVEQTNLRDALALFVVTAVLVIVVGGAGWLLGPPVVDQATEVMDRIPEAVDELQQLMETTAAGRRAIEELAELDPAQLLRGEILGPLGGAIFGVAGAIGHGVFVIAVGVYLAFDPEVYKRGIVRMVPMSYRERAAEILDVCSHQLAWWLIGRLLAMLGVAVLITVGLWILGIPLPIFLGVLAGLFSFVPILGAIVSYIPAALIALLVAPQYVIWVAFVFLGAQAVESYWITPVVQHRFVSLPHAMTLIAEIFAGILFGLIGITIATPLAVLLMALVNMIYVEDVLGDTTPFTELAEKRHH